MSRNFAQLHHRIWNDPDFISLGIAEQRLYMLLLSQDSMNYAGVLDLTVGRWARKAPDTTAADVRASLSILHERNYVLVDEDTEEALIRSFIRNDELWRNVRMLRVAVREARQVQSEALRRVLADELSRLPAVAIPTDPTKTKAIAEAEAAQAEVNEAIVQLGGGGWGPQGGTRQPLAQPLPQPLAQGVAQPLAQGAGYGTGAGTGDGAVSSYAFPSKTDDQVFRGDAYVSRGEPEHPPLYPNHCPRHAHQPVPGNCGDCADTRKANAARPPALTLVGPDKRCLIHDTTYATRCGGCEADRKAAG